jgi:hypothetical protein
MIGLWKRKWLYQSWFRAALVVSLSLILTVPTFASKTWYVLSSTQDGSGGIFVRDDITIAVNGNTVVEDSNGASTHLSPVTLYLDKGDTMDITVSDSYSGAKVDESTERPSVSHERFLSPLYLVNTATGEALPVFKGIPEMKSNWQGGGTYITIHYTVETPMQEFCLSSVPGECYPARFNEDLSLFNITQTDYSVEMTPDQNAGDSEFVMHLFLPVPQGDEDYPTISLKVTNWRRSGGVSPLYLVAVPYGATYTLIPQEIHIEGNCNKMHMCHETTVFYGTFEVNDKFLFSLNAQYKINIEEILYPVNTLRFEYKNFDGAPHCMYVYCEEPDGSILFVDNAGRTNPYPVLFCLSSSDFVYEAPLPDYGEKARLFTVGKYTAKALSLDGKSTYSGTLAVRPDEGDLEDIQLDPPDVPLPSISSETQPMVTVETLLSEAYEENHKTPIGSFSFTTTTTTVSCNVYLPTDEGFNNGALVQYQRESPDTGEMTWAIIVECQDSGSDPVTLSKVAEVQGTVDVNEIATVNLNQKVSLGENNEAEAYYNSIPWVFDTPSTVSYKYHLIDKSENQYFSFSSSTHSRSINPASAITKSPLGYTYGCIISFRSTSFGELVVDASSFAVDVEGVSHTPHKGEYKAKVYVDFDADGKADVVYTMEEVSAGQFRQTASLSPIPYPEDADTLSFAYWIEVTDASGNELPGELSHRVQTVSVSAPENNEQAVFISGDSMVSLGEHLSLTGHFIVGGDEPMVLKPYLGIYKEGRGVVWLHDTITNGYEVSATETPLIPFVSVQQCSASSPCTETISIDLPPPEDTFSSLFPGKYNVIVLFKDTKDNVVTSGGYPVRITP